MKYISTWKCIAILSSTIISFSDMLCRYAWKKQNVVPCLISALIQMILEGIKSLKLLPLKMWIAFWSCGVLKISEPHSQSWGMQFPIFFSAAKAAAQFSTIWIKLVQYFLKTFIYMESSICCTNISDAKVCKRELLNQEPSDSFPHFSWKKYPFLKEIFKII